MKDQYNREINYMRISVTDRCNLRCAFCMPQGNNTFFPPEAILGMEEILRIVQAAAGLGIRTFRLTGGEPLVRPDIVELTEQIAALCGVERVTMTTNGILLEEKVEPLVTGGLYGVNISLCTADEVAYERVTGSKELERVHRGINAAVAAGLRVRLNCVPMQGVNLAHITGVAAYARSQPVDVRFIEMMPIGRGGEFSYVESGQVRKLLEQEYGRAQVCARQCADDGSGPAEYYRFPGFVGRVGFISARSHKFCAGCNRVRLTADGRLQLCLDSAESVDLRKVLGTADAAQLMEVMQEAIYKKPREHSFDKETRRGEKYYMSQIGG